MRGGSAARLPVSASGPASASASASVSGSASGLRAGPAEPGPDLGTPTALGLAAWTDGLLMPVVLSEGGVHVCTGSDPGLASAWQVIATPRTPLARDVAFCVAGAAGHVAWSDADGVHVVRVDRGDARQLGTAEPGPARRVATGPDGGDVRFPVAAVAAADGTLDLIWTADRRRLVRVTDRPGFPASDPVELPRCCAPGERLRGLDLTVESEKTAWLACATDRGRLLVARWDLRYDVHAPWQPVRLPVPAADMVAMACAGNQPTVVLATRAGELWVCDARVAAEDGTAAWQSIDLPGTLGGRRLQAVAAADDEGAAWLAVAGGRRLCHTRLLNEGGRMSCGVATEVVVGN